MTQLVWLSLGDTNFVSSQNAAQMRLTYVSEAGNAIIKIDNTTVVPDQQKRDSVRVLIDLKTLVSKLNFFRYVSLHRNGSP